MACRSNESDSGEYLAVYGSLAPGEVNASVLASLPGEWQAGTVRGILHKEGWGWTSGFPGLRLDAAGGVVNVMLLHSPELPLHWGRIDEFEGEQYRRCVTEVTCDGAMFCANIYVLAL